MGGLDARWVRGGLQTAATDDSIEDEAADSSSEDQADYDTVFQAAREGYAVFLGRRGLLGRDLAAESWERGRGVVQWLVCCPVEPLCVGASTGLPNGVLGAA
jgi:hypothetical protein